MFNGIDLKLARIQRTPKMKQKDLARRLGIGQNLLSEFENGIRVILPPGVENKILKIFPELKNSERKIIESDK